MNRMNSNRNVGTTNARLSTTATAAGGAREKSSAWLLGVLIASGCVAWAGCGDDSGGAGGAGGQGPTSGATTGGTGGAASTGSTATTGSASGSGGAGGGANACSRGVLEEDLMGQGPDGSPAPVVWFGPGADPETGELLPEDGTFIASTTYLELEADPAVQQRFGELVAPMIGELLSNPDLVAVRLGTSASCGTARTYAVWRSIEGMMQFAMGDAHQVAVDEVGEISRGGSMVTHWEGATIASLTWDEALSRLAAIDGPQY